MNDGFEAFCGSPLWEQVSPGNNASNYQLTICLRTTFVYWVPLIAYGVSLPFWLSMLEKRKIPPKYLKPSPLFYFKTLISLSLIAMSIIMLITGAVEQRRAKVAPAFYVLWTLLALTFASSLFVIQRERKRGKYSSMLLFILFLALLVASIPSVTDFYKEDSKSLNTAYLIFFALLVIAAVVLMFPEGHKFASADLTNHNVCPEYYAGVLQKLYFSFITRLVLKGYRRALMLDDLWDLDETEKSSSLCKRLAVEWEKQIAAKPARRSSGAVSQGHISSADVTSSPEIQFVFSAERRWKLVNMLKNRRPRGPSIAIALVKAFKGKLIFSAFLKLIYDIMQFMPPLILGLILNSIQDLSSPLSLGIALSFLMFANNFVQTCILHQYFQRMMLIGQRWRTAIMAMVYQKSLVLSSDSKQRSTVGEMVNLMSVDAQRLMELSSYMQIIWSGPLQIIVAIGLLWNTLGPSIVAGIAVLVLAIPLNTWIGNKLKNLQGSHMKLKDIRIKDMNEILNGIKVIKLYAWEHFFTERISETRRAELTLLKKTSILNAVVSLIWTITPFMVSVITFAVYVVSSTKNILTAEKAFVSLSLFGILRFPLFMFATVLTNFVQARVSMRRIENFLMLEEFNPDFIERKPLEENAITVTNGNFGWNKEDIALTRIDFNVQKRNLVAVVGDVGCGKTAFLQAMLGELNRTSGSVQIDGRMAYVPQQAWILNATVRDNILMLLPFNEKLYEAVIDACDLRSDFQMLPAGDKTEIGERGINLSGGQKQRISLARAIYSNADIYLLDDPLSAVDSHVAKHIFSKAIGPTGLLSKKTRVLVTNALAFMPKCHSIIVLRDGSISEAGKFGDLLDANGDFANLARQYLQDLNSATDNSDGDETDVEDLLHQLSDRLSVLEASRSSLDDKAMPESAPTKGGKTIGRLRKIKRKVKGSKKGQLKHGKDKKKHGRAESAVNQLTTAEHIETTKINKAVVMAYFNSYGRYIELLFPVMFLLTVAAQLGYNLWLSDWSSNAESEANNTARRDLRIGIYALLGCLHGFVYFGIQVLLLMGAYKASVELHKQLLQRCIRGTMNFFDSTPVGRIINRFSKDIDALDYTLPGSLRSSVSTFATILSTLIAITITNPIFLAVAFPIAILFFFLQRFYIRTSRQLRRIESVTRSPIYSHFSESIQGLQCIRASALSNGFIQKNHLLNDTNVKSYYPSILINRWLAMILETLANIIVFAACILAVTNRRAGFSGLAGLAISNALQITQALNWVVRMISEIETNIVAVERVIEYCHIENEPEWFNDNKKLDNDWPANGSIAINNYFLRYRENLEPVLKNITMDIKPREKVGLVGRTGAGKSSLTAGLFRLVETTEGEIIIDNESIKDMGVHQLRQKITVLPQDAVIFSGKLRYNLDPFGQCDDEQVWTALRNASLEEFVKSLPNQLNYEVSEGGENLSSGQRQLFCLARALLRHSRILVLDEATAAVDMETDDLIQGTIRKEFRDCTVITIAHRINTILDYDRIAVFDSGCLREFDTPKALLSNEDSLFASLVRDANIRTDNSEDISKED